MRPKIPGQNLAWLRSAQTVGEIVGSTRIFRLVSACAPQKGNPGFTGQYKRLQVALNSIERSAKPVFMGSNPIRCSNISITYCEMKKRDSGYCSGKCSEYRALLCSLPCCAECNQFCRLVQSYSAIQCNGMLPPSAITKGCARSHSHRRRAVPRLRFGQGDVRFEGVRCG
jgi:hypothetical protein